MKYRGSSFVRWIVTTASKIFGSDAEDRAGVGPFSLPMEHPFTRAARVHDFYFTEVRRLKELGLPLDEYNLMDTDMKLFRAWVAIIYAQESVEDQIGLAVDLCAFYPAALKVGLFLFQGPKEPID